MISGYGIVEEIYRGRRRVVYRGNRDHDGVPVIIKTFTNDFLPQKDIAALKHEYDILHNLKIDGIPKTYGLDKYNGRLALILEDIGGEPLRNLIDAKQIDLTVFLEIGIQLSRIVGELHQNNVIHKDINPKNVIVNLRTRQVRLIDFSISSLLPFENPTISYSNLLEGTLAYISPEQTGRMNRAIDYRTDFYSLGITFYEMLTGKLPFNSSDPLELVHFHIAKIPIPPHELNPPIPQVISNIVMKLLAKTAEERYKSPYGLKADLEACLVKWQASQKIEDFVPGQNDFSDRFQIPQKLYGREEEIETLMATFERVSDGTTEMMLVSGYSGIGKTALISEVHKPIVRQKGYFISGKFDQFKRNIPYSAVIQAFQELVRQLLTESENQVGDWKDRLTDALGPNGQVIVDVIPEVELIIGRQPAVPELPPTESQNRFNLVFERFIEVFAQKQHPLVMFLDDLQWADSATLNLLKILMADPNIQFLFVIGAYRDNEVSPAHPLIRTLSEIEKTGARLRNVTLKPLGFTHLNQLIADTLRCETTRSKPLAELVLSKTDGNPFFVTQFLKSLYQERLVQLDYDSGEWQFDLDRVYRMGMTDNVVELMAGKIQRLSKETQHISKLAACVGNQFDLNTLAIVNERSLSQTAHDLWEAIREGLILPISDLGLRIAESSSESEIQNPRSAIYRFLHDRVQQAAYALIPDDQKKTVHLKIGRLMLQHSDENEREEQLFDIVNHFNIGLELITEQEERIKLTELNLQAGQKAKSSTAYKPALSYLNIGLNLLSVDKWTSEYEPTFTLYRELAECEYLCGNFDKAEEYFDLLLSRAGTNLEKAQIYNMKIIQYENMAQYTKAVQAGAEGLKLFGIVFPETEEEKKTAFHDEMQVIQTRLGKRQIEDLVHLPVMTEPEMKMGMKLLMTVWAPAYIAADVSLTVLISAKMVSLSLLYGNTEESAYAYVIHAVTVGTGLGDYRSGYEYGRLALSVNEKFNDLNYRAKIHHMFSCFVNFWRMPLKTCFTHSKEAYRSGLESGDFAYSTYAVIHESWHALLSGFELSQFNKDYTPNVSFLKQIKNYSFADAQQLILQWGLNLQGLTESKYSFSDNTFDEETYLQTYKGNAFFETFYFATKLHILYTFEKYSTAKEMALNAEGVIHALHGTLWDAVLCFYQALTLTALYHSATAKDQKEFWKKLEDLRTKMKIWAANCPENFLNQYLLISAEMTKITDRYSEAMDLYEGAIRSARENGFIQNEALANELYARYWLQRRN
ncbi:MAG TPA: serine/threonine-protein kinase PknK, partial [Thermodesulfobacteriota bacterium]|nr:serine/threonine-protein kinase PknK [Thermodesulfobacteriota bacterium]